MLVSMAVLLRSSEQSFCVFRNVRGVAPAIFLYGALTPALGCAGNRWVALDACGVFTGEQ